MAARIRREDIATVREKARIEEVVGEHVSLRPGGVGSLKGLCPFHDERTPSFNVRPQMGLWHCFGCGEGGDVISFVQKIDHLPFGEAVERLAGRYAVELRYEDDGGPARPREEPGKRQRLVEANRAAAEFFVEQLVTPEAAPGRAFLAERGFDRQAATTFGVGYAPQGWDALMRHLQGRGFTQAELAAAGLVSQGNRGHYDRFRGRLIWPIRDLTGDTVGFGARRLYDDDPGPKYLNTPETPLYRKSQVLYGIDLAKKAIATGRQVVVVEGYTDVMACHLAGVGTAVATCGTAFGSDHTRIVRRLLGDSATGATGVLLSSGRAIGGEVVFTFDGDEAGQKAALRAFGEDQSFAAQTFVAVSADGMDPCEVRVAHGDAAVRALVAGREPMFEFAIRSVLAQVDLSTAEGRVAGLRVTAPVVAGIRDYALRAEYARQLAGWLGMDPGDVRREVQRGPRGGQGGAAGQGGGRERETDDGEPRLDRAPRRTPVPDDPVARLERQVLEVALQAPTAAAGAGFDALAGDTFTLPVHRAVHDALRAAGGAAAGVDAPPRWLADVLEGAPEGIGAFVRELTVAPLPTTEDDVADYAAGVVLALRRLGITREIANLRGRAQAMEPSDPAQREAWTRIYQLEEERHRLTGGAA
ncbi:DNA primase [Miniimonas sp. S16]|uniref:DNA primase n=1 Tax=Miniimonas sp. S16 TaxID=2171623 RepID=UPI000D5263E6|nr:DNA primase [Miniimonas sp. S16]